MNFLQAVAKDIYSEYGNEISSLTLVLPSRRAQLFFFDELTALIDKPVWSPAYMSLEEVVSSFTQLKKLDDFALLMLLYEVYRKYTNSSESFDKFYFWGETLLNDFDDIDKYLVDVKLLFGNLKAQKDLEGDLSFLTDEQISYIRQFWKSFDPKSRLQNQFIEIWDVLLPIYNDFKSTLNSRNQAYTGMIYRDAAERMQQGTVAVERKYIFIGFNALGECELSLFSYLKQIDKARFYWDYDRYYINDKSQEAGQFLRRNIERFPSPKSFDIPSEFLLPKDIHIIAAPSDALQAKALPELLKDMNVTFDKKTAIVLIDESLLIPALYSLPDKCEDINITLGYPLLQTPVFTLAELLIRLQNSYKTGNSGFYYKDVLAILRHRYISVFAEQEVRTIVRCITETNRVYVDIDLFGDNELLALIFRPLSGYGELTEYLTSTFARIAAMPADNEPEDLRKEYIFHITKSLNKLKKAIDEINPDISKAVFLSLLRGVFRGLKIPFMGEPLKGLQIMGIHETRALDFDNLILLSVNEGRLPPDTHRVSYIPYNLRRGYGLPCPEHQEATAAYNFYRLIQRAKNIRLVYSSKSDANRTGEMSRYLYQLKFETAFNPKEYPVTCNISFNSSDKITVEKDKSVQQALLQYTGADAPKSLSPSAISSYISCPLKFYFSKIVKLEPDESITDELPLNLFGNILHKVMETLYSPLKHTATTEQTLDAVCRNYALIDSLIDKFFAEEFYKTDSLPKDFSENGKLFLTRDVIRKYVKGVLQYDKNNAGFIPLGFEEKIRILFPADKLTVSLHGIIDRVDMLNNNLRIVDYKTGAGRYGKRLRFNGIASLFDPNPDTRNKEAFQTFLYALLYDENRHPAEPIIPALYFVRDCYLPNFTCLLTDDEKKKSKTGSNTPNEVMDFNDYKIDFTRHLAQCLCNIFDFSVPFIQTEYVKTCQSCSFINICRKTKEN
jgi:hypothetical protein